MTGLAPVHGAPGIVPGAPLLDYDEYLRRKVKLAESHGEVCEIGGINPALKEHQKLMVRWLVEGGRRACFAAFGVGKTVIQLETVRLTLERAGGRGLIVCPLGARHVFQHDAVAVLGWSEPPKFVRRIEECGPEGIYLTNYETIRDGKMDPQRFSVASLDEAAVLRGFGGTKTFREFMRLFTGDEGPKAGTVASNRRGVVGVPYRFVATATPSPNDYIELLAYADFLGVMDTSAAKTRFFKRDSTKADTLTLHPHKEQEFWLWVASWALFVQRPSDLDCDDAGYVLPALDVRWHEVETDHSEAGYDRHGQGRLLKDSAVGVSESAREKRDSLPGRIAKMLELRADDPAAHRIIWHDLEAERHAIEKAIPECVTVYGTQHLDDREKALLEFGDGKIQELAGKPVMIGAGPNLQHHCHWAIYLGIGYKFADFIQSIHRLQRYMQGHPVRVDLIYTEAERGIKKSLERKWRQHEKQVEIMQGIIKQFGLSQAAMAQQLTRSMGVERREEAGDNWKLVNEDSIKETRRMESNSVGLIVTSIPFSTQYEYSPNYADLGHSDGNGEFFGQMDYLTPELFRVLQPGRIAAIHVKDRIVPGGMTGLGFQTVYPFHLHTIEHYTRHGFAYLGMKTIVTDVVRENAQTYRLGWSEQCKDGTKMGVGMPEYLLLFRKPPTDTSNAYADAPVLKDKPECVDETGAVVPYSRDKKVRIVPNTGYSRSRWQIDAHGYERSSGERLMDPNDLLSIKHSDIFKLFRRYSLEEVYNHEHHVKIGEMLESTGKLPVTFMLLQPQSWSDEVWTDITRMLTLNGAQYAKGREMHLCPMQFDIADRVIHQMSNPGDVVYDPFSGLGTVPMRAVMQGRYGLGCELSLPYHLDAVTHVRGAAAKIGLPTLFDLPEDGCEIEDEVAGELVAAGID